MAQHINYSSMIKESLSDTLEAAGLCLNFRKPLDINGRSGCLGYPASLLLFSIIDTIGSYYYKSGQTFKILNDPRYYNLSLEKEDLKIIKNKCRDLLAHHMVIGLTISLTYGNQANDIFMFDGKLLSINLVRLFNETSKCIEKFLNSPEGNIDLSKHAVRFKSV